MRLIVGLGNPGMPYAWTPHNLGFLAVDAIAEGAGIRRAAPRSEVAGGLGAVAGQRVSPWPSRRR
jgi:PTH1 family peptidyl-tRNA hydrolase